MSLYDEVILPSLYHQGYLPQDILDYTETDYVTTYNPLTTDIKTKSAMIFKETGVLKLLNGTIRNIKTKREETTATLTTWLRSLNCGLHYYISYNISDMDMDKTIIYEIKDYIKNKMLNIPQKYNRHFEEIRKEFYKRYILDIDVIALNTNFVSEVRKIPASKKPKVVESSTEYMDCTKLETEAVGEYLKKRGLKLSIKEKRDNVLFKTIVYNDTYRKPSVCFSYEDGFFKYRLIHETDKRYRFRSKGRYQNFFIARRNNTKKLYIVEGEIEALSILDFITDDVFAIHNTNSLPSNLSLLEGYSEIVIKIDADRYEENKKAFSKINCIVDFKTFEEGKDYNDLLIENKLSKQIIENINTMGGINMNGLKIEKETKRLRDELSKLKEKLEEIQSGMAETMFTVDVSLEKSRNIKDVLIDDLVSKIYKEAKKEKEEEMQEAILKVKNENEKELKEMKKKYEEAQQEKQKYTVEYFMQTIEKNMPEKIVNHAIWDTIKSSVENSISEVI